MTDMGRILEDILGIRSAEAADLIDFPSSGQPNAIATKAARRINEINKELRKRKSLSKRPPDA